MLIISKLIIVKEDLFIDFILLTPYKLKLNYIKNEFMINSKKFFYESIAAVHALSLCNKKRSGFYNPLNFFKNI